MVFLVPAAQAMWLSAIFMLHNDQQKLLLSSEAAVFMLQEQPTHLHTSQNHRTTLFGRDLTRPAPPISHSKNSALKTLKNSYYTKN